MNLPSAGIHAEGAIAAMEACIEKLKQGLVVDFSKGYCRLGSDFEVVTPAERS